MKIITGLSEQPKQQSTLVLADGTRAVWTLAFVPQQAGWFYDLTWNGTAIASGQRLVSSPNILRQYLNRISFGIAVISPNQLDPETQTTFVDGSITCYLLEGADLQTVETDLFDAPPGQVLPEVALPSGEVVPVPPGGWGPAGGDLAYLYPNPQVVAVHEGGGARLPFAAVADGQFLKRVGDEIIGAAVAPGTGDVVGPGASVVGHVAIFNSVTGDLLADGGPLGTAAAQNVGYFTLVNAAMSGDLGGTLPSPTVVAVHTGATKLTIGTIADGEFVKRVGTTLVGFVPSGAGDVVGPASSVNGTMALFDGITGKLLKEGLVPGTMAGQNANAVAITGGSIGSVAITEGSVSGAAILAGTASGVEIIGGTMDGTPIGVVTRDVGNFTAVDVTGAISAATGDFDGIALNPFALFSPSAGVLRFSGISAVNTLQGYDGTNAYCITLYDGTTPKVILQSNGVSYFVEGIDATTIAGNASAATSKPAATGSVLRSFASRAGDVFNVKDYGATGDGTTDDTAACQAALDALVANTRGKLYCPSGRYVVSSALTLGSNPTVQIQVEGDGKGATEIRFTSTSAAAAFDFDFTGIADPRQNYATFFNLTVRAYAANCKRLVKLKNNGSSSHQYPGCQLHQVLFLSDFTNYANTLLEFDGCWNTITRDCTFTGQLNANLTSVDCVGTGLLVNATSRLSVNGLVDGCRFQFLNKMFYIGGVDGSGYANNSVSGTSVNCEGWTLRDNVSVGINYGITHLYASGSTPPQVPWLASKNNEMEMYRSGYAYNLKNVAYFSCSDAVVLFDTSANQYGFKLDQVSFSQIYDNQLGSNVAYPFYFTNNCGVVKVHDNICGGDGAVYGFFFDSAVNNNQVRDNVFVTAPATYLSDAGTNNSVDSQGSVSWNPASLAPGQSDVITVSVPGCKAGCTATLGTPYDLQGMTATVGFFAGGIMRIELYNSTAGTIDLGAGTWYVRTINPGP